MRRLAVVIGLILIYTVVLLGRGLPFWLVSALYVTASIVLLQAPQRALAGRALGWRDIAFAAAVGIGSGVVIALRLPGAVPGAPAVGRSGDRCSPDSPTSPTPGSAS